MACSRQPAEDAGHWTAVDRWIEGSPEGALGLADVLQSKVIWDWTFASPKDLQIWNASGFDVAYELTDSGLYVRSSGIDPWLWRETDFAAADVDVIQLSHSGLSGSYAQIFWAAEGEPFTEERSLKVSTEETKGRLAPTYSFRLFEHPLWEGQIRRFRIDPTSKKMGKVELRRVTGLSYEASQDDLARVAGAATQVDVDADVRFSILAPPGVPLERSIDLPPGARFQLGFALPFNKGPAVTFRVSAVRSSGESRVLHEQILDPKIDSGRWFDLDLSLSDEVKDRVVLVLETETDRPLDSPLAVPVWSSPKVLAVTAKKKTRQPNVVVILVDTLRADRLSLYGHDRPTSPNLDKWAERRGVVFENTVASAPWTLPAHVSLFTGLNAMKHGVNYTHSTPTELKLLAEQLREVGYSTAAVTGGAFLHPKYGLQQGFERFLYWREGDQDQNSKDLAKGLEKSLKWIDELPRPFFLFLHTYEVHSPYRARDPWFRDFAGDAWPAEVPPPVFTTASPWPDPDAGWRFDSTVVEHSSKSAEETVPLTTEHTAILNANYDSGIAKTDQMLGSLFDHLAESGSEDDSIVVFTSDHGEALGERGRGGHAYLWDFNLRIPLVIAFPGGQGAGQRITKQVRTIDLMPTLVEFLELENAEPMDGQSLMTLISDPSAEFPSEAESYAGSSNYGLSLRHANKWKYIYQHSAWPPVHGESELFDLEQDPAEKINLVGTEVDLTAALHQELLRRFLKSSSHLRLQVRNTSQKSIRLNVRGPLSHAFTVKAFQLPPDTVTWARKEMTVNLRPSEEVMLFLEGEAVGEILVRLEAVHKDPGGQFRRLISVPDLVEPLSVCLEGGRWGQCPELPNDGTGFHMWWHGTLFGSGEPLVPSDEALQQQLQALGYL